MHRSRRQLASFQAPQCLQVEEAEEEEESIYKLVSEGPVVSHGKEQSPLAEEPAAVLEALASPRNNPKTKKKLVSHHDSRQVSNLFNPSKGIRDELQRRGVEPKNHARENKAAIANASVQNRVRKQEESLASSMKALSTNATSPPRRRPSVSATTSAAGQSHVLRNMLNAASSQPTRRVSEPPNHEAYRHKENGRVPAYLQRRKEEMAQDAEKRREAEERKKLPAGMVLMDEEDRLATLQSLQESKLKVEAQIRALPLRMGLETPSQMRFKKGLEDQHDTIQDAIKKFSRPKVYVQDPSVGTASGAAAASSSSSTHASNHSR